MWLRARRCALLYNALMTVVMLIMIATGLGMILAALVYVGTIGYRLYKAVREATVYVQRPMDEITKRQIKTTETLTRIDQRTTAIETNMAAISRNSHTLGYLQSELTGSVKGLVRRTAKTTPSGQTPPNPLG